MKKCFKGNKGGRIAFLPKNQYTEEIAEYFKFYEEDIIYFDQKIDLDTYMRSSEYNKINKNGTRN